MRSLQTVAIILSGMQHRLSILAMVTSGRATDCTNGSNMSLDGHSPMLPIKLEVRIQTLQLSYRRA